MLGHKARVRKQLEDLVETTKGKEVSKEIRAYIKFVAQVGLSKGAVQSRLDWVAVVIGMRHGWGWVGEQF